MVIFVCFIVPAPTYFYKGRCVGSVNVYKRQGFDNYTPLGRKEFGGTAALPIWIEFMREALKDSPQTERPLPPGIVHVRIDPDSGLLAEAGQHNAILEYFREEHVPEQGGGDGSTSAGTSGTDDLIKDIF